MSNEVRNTKGTVELRAAKSDKSPGRAWGYAAKFNRRSQDLGGFIEVIAPGCFDRTIGEADVTALFNHVEEMLLARSVRGEGTLDLWIDETGLGYEFDLPDTTHGRNLAEHLRREDITGSSFAFRTIDDEWSETEDGRLLRTLKQVALADVSPVVHPAYLDTDSALRSLAKANDLDLTEIRKAAETRDLPALIRATKERNAIKGDEGTGPKPSARRRDLDLLT